MIHAVYFQVKCVLLFFSYYFSPGKRAVVGYEDGTVRVWDLKQGNAIHVIKGECENILFYPPVTWTLKLEK